MALAPKGSLLPGLFLLFFVDSIEEGIATLISAKPLPDGTYSSMRVPSFILPANTKEGTWIDMTTRAASPPKKQADAALLRSTMKKDDPAAAGSK